jgi:hypothetical protein
LTPGGSSTVHIYTQTIHRTTQKEEKLIESFTALKIHRLSPLILLVMAGRKLDKGLGSVGFKAKGGLWF